MFKINNKDTRMTPIASFWRLYFEQVNAGGMNAIKF